jgi:hypothetical protein
MLRARPSTKKKCQVGYKRSQNKLQAPSQKKATSLSSSESLLLEYEQRSESDDNGKRHTVDKQQKGPKMAVTGVNQGRNEMGKDGNDDVVEGPTGEARHKSHRWQQLV